MTRRKLPCTLDIRILIFSIIAVFLLVRAPPPATAAPGVNLTVTTVLDEANDDYPQVPAGTIGHVRRSPCGAVGCFFLNVVDVQNGLYRVQLVFHETRPTGAFATELVDSIDTATPDESLPTLLYDAVCRPRGIRLRDNTYESITRNGDSWTVQIVDLDLPAITGSTEPTTLVHHGAELDADGTLHLLFSYTVQGGGSGFVHAVRSPSGWTYVLADPLANILSVALAPDGTIHAAYSVPDPITFANELHYAATQGGAWSTELVLSPTDIDTEVDLDPVLRVTPDGTVAIVSTWRESIPALPYKRANLRYTRRNGADDWVSTVVASATDGYLGNQGGNFTGGMPDLAFDADSNPHIAFTDIALSRDSLQRPWYATGQLRYAFRIGTAWEITTLFTQSGPADSPNPVEEFLFPALVVSPGGGHVAFLGVERLSQSESPEFDPNVVRDFRALLFMAVNLGGSDATATPLDAILGRAMATPEMDENSDGVVDIADVLASNVP